MASGETNGDLRPGGLFIEAPEVVEAVETFPTASAALAHPVEPPPAETILRGLQSVRIEMAERDGELRDVLARLGRMYQRLAIAVEDDAERSPADNETLRALLRSVDALALVTEGSIDRASDLGRSLQRMVETLQGLATRVDRLATRGDEADARVDRLTHLVEGMSEQVAMIGRHLGTGADRPRPRLRAVGIEADQDQPR